MPASLTKTTVSSLASSTSSTIRSRSLCSCRLKSLAFRVMPRPRHSRFSSLVSSAAIKLASASVVSKRLDASERFPIGVAASINTLSKLASKRDISSNSRFDQAGQPSPIWPPFHACHNSCRLIIRFGNLANPRLLIFDETYYVKDAYTLGLFGSERNWQAGANAEFEMGNLSGFLDTAAYVVHPPLGKWVICLACNYLVPTQRLAGASRQHYWAR